MEHWAGTAANFFLTVREELWLALMFPEDVELEVCDASEQWETALKTIESASTFASTFVFSHLFNLDKAIAFTGLFESDSNEMPVFRRVCGVMIQKSLF